MEMPMIEARELAKTFDHRAVLEKISFSVEAGEVFGLLGPNGAGKTTTLRVLLGLLRIESGQVSVLGMDPWRDAVELHRRLAYVPGDVSLWPNLTGGEVIDLLGRLRGGLNQQRRAELIEMFDLDPTKKTRAYSKGNRQKVALISAMASDVELLLLDEPTAGLDPLMESMFRGIIDDWRGDGRSVLLSSHILAEAEALSDRLSIIRDGRVVETGTLTQMRHLLRTSVTAVLHGAPDGLTSIAGLHDVVVDGTTVTCQADADALDDLLRALATAGVESLTTQPPSLEQLFLQHYGKT